MEALIPVLSKLQDVFAATGSREMEVHLPQIIVVGSQSSGKSSVIEGIVGRDFLPRGTGIVTRQPLLLHLVHTSSDDSRRQEDPRCKEADWAVFEPMTNFPKRETYFNFDEVREQISLRTNVTSGENKNITNDVINLKIFSDRVVDLSLVDLPGITKVPVGDQPPNIEKLVHNMIHDYISNPNSIVLAVTPANQDFATSEALKMAREVDPDGNRTICVLTKLDLMDHGTNAMDVLMGKLVPVKLGIIGVVNRSQADIVANKSIDDCLRDENIFLSKTYPTLANRNGIKFLARTLNRLLMHHIRECLPSLKLRVNTLSAQCQTLLHSYGDEVVDKRRALLQIITHFANAYTSTIDGTAKNIETAELCGGARIGYIFHDTFGNTLENIDPMGGLSTLEILTAIRNATGPRPPLFVPEVSFELLVKRQIRRLEEPSLTCVDLVYEEMLRIVQHCGTDIQQEMQRFPRLYERIHEVVTGVLSGRLSPTKEFVANIVGIQLAYINTKHPEFTDGALVQMLCQNDIPSTKVCTDTTWNETVVRSKTIHKTTEESSPPTTNGVAQSNAAGDNNSGTSSIASWLFNKNLPKTILETDQQLAPVTTQAVEKSLSRSLTTREKRDTGIVERLIRGYFAIVRQSVQDLVPKAIMKFLVNFVRDNLQSELVRILYNDESIDELLSESDFMAQRRKDAADMLDALTKANKVISEIRESYVW